VRTLMLIFAGCSLIFGFAYSLFATKRRGITPIQSVLDPPTVSEALYLFGGICLLWFIFWDLIPPKFQGAYSE